MQKSQQLCGSHARAVQEADHIKRICAGHCHLRVRGANHILPGVYFRIFGRFDDRLIKFSADSCPELHESAVFMRMYNAGGRLRNDCSVLTRGALRHISVLRHPSI